MRATHQYSFQSRHFEPRVTDADDDDEDEKGEFGLEPDSWREDPTDPAPAVLEEKFHVINASTPFLGALESLDLLMESKREMLRAMDAPQTWLDLYERKNLLDNLKEQSNGIWVHRFPGTTKDYCEMRCLEIVKAEV